jgi:Na+/H+ antiporter NhaC
MSLSCAGSQLDSVFSFAPFAYIRFILVAVVVLLRLLYIGIFMNLKCDWMKVETVYI